MTKLSIIVATYNRHESLRQMLGPLLKVETKDDFSYEIVVVDNNSTDDTRRTVESFQPQSGVQLRYEREEQQGKPFALNRGIQAAKGDILVFTDDDVTVPHDWLWQLYQCFHETGCDGVGGRVLPVFTPDTPQWIRDNPVKLAGGVVIYDYGEGTSPHVSGRFHFIGANFAFKREVFDDCGMFRTDLIFDGRIALGEDTEFIERLIAKNKKLMYCGKALIWHPFDPSRLEFRHMARWHVAVGRFDALREITKGENFVYFSGIPRYLIKGIIVDALAFIVNCANRLSFMNVWRSFFRKVGMIKQYRDFHNQQSVTKTGA